MGRSPSSCFRILACAGEPADNDDVSPPQESKTSLVKSRWSFRKRSPRHHVLSNSVISEPLSFVNEKQGQEASADTLTTEKVLVPDKGTDAEQRIDNSTLSSSTSPEPQHVTDRSTGKADIDIQENIVLFMQAAIRGYMAQRELQKLKNIVKVQAAVRGYLVRKQAVGTLRCLLAIVKMQVLIRTRHSARSTEFTATKNHDVEMPSKLVKNYQINSSKTPSAIRKLVSNAFPRKLLESMPKSKPIHISCNSSMSDSGSQWLERWMTYVALEKQNIIPIHDDLGKDVKAGLITCEVNDKFQFTPGQISFSKCAPSDQKVTTEAEDNLTNKSFGELEAPRSVVEQCSNSLAQDDQLTHGSPEKGSDSADNQLLLATDADLHSVPNSTEYNVDHDEELPKNISTTEFLETLETEEGNVVIGSRKSRNPSFVAVQAKFEELNSTSCLSRHAGESKLVQTDSKSEEVCETKSGQYQVDSINKEVSLTEEMAGHSSSGQNISLNCGTEGHIFSVLGEIRTNNDNMKSKTNDISLKLDLVEPQQMVENCENRALSNKAEEFNASNIQLVELAKDPQIDELLQEGSPKSHFIVPEFHGTPSSQISMPGKISKAENNIAPRKQRAQSAVKSSPTNSKDDSGLQSSGKSLHKDLKNAKRRNSFGMAKTDHVDHENRNIGTHSLPSYMQPTESAKAKVHPSISQKSSPDSHQKKGHSLPGADERQDSSPRMQRPTLQAPQNMKGNERRWIR
ncbi:Protein IQ-domain 32 [Apostasia shenzhenica]|uniref:Protein IQ-domain 32 n=1 Tax=Apostasia shenzhenica TaxID=1088818 RepID=A0A2I0AWX7_9ASPA|nr:Protein IQ-domain 32 [Apostasia shenzhenica]